MKKKLKKVKEDLVGIALIYLAVECSKKMNAYVEALLNHVSLGKSKAFRENADNMVWDLVYEETSYEDFKKDISKFKEKKNE